MGPLPTAIPAVGVRFIHSPLPVNSVNNTNPLAGVTIGFQLLFALTILIGACCCPESPAVLAKWQKWDEAGRSYAILKNLPLESPHVDKAMQELLISLDEEKSCGDVTIMECFRGCHLRRTTLGVVMSFLTIATGITFWFGYGTTFFMAAGVSNSYLISMILAIVNCAFTLPSIYLIEKLGRRRCLIWGGVIMAVTQLLTGAIHTAAPDSTASRNMLVAGVIIFIAAYAPSWGIGGWVIMTGPFSNRLRVYQTAIVMTCYWFCQWLVGFITPYMVDETAGNLRVNVAYIWFGMGTISVVWAYFWVPELSGLSISEVDTLFEEKVPARKSSVCKARLRIIESTETTPTEKVEVMVKSNDTA
jgi:SP family sugar:H+ symporter-like MFS transporter